MVQEELSESPGARYHHLELKDSPDLDVVAQGIAQFTNGLWDKGIRAGHTIIFVFKDDEIMAEHLAVSSLQRRRQEAVHIVIRRKESRQAVPYLLRLEKEENGRISTDYNYHKESHSCSGNCKGHK